MSDEGQWCDSGYCQLAEVSNYAKELKEKLAIAVMEAFKEGFAAGAADGWQNNPRILNEWKRSKAFAEIKGESHE